MSSFSRARKKGFSDKSTYESNWNSKKPLPTVPHQKVELKTVQGFATGLPISPLDQSEQKDS